MKISRIFAIFSFMITSEFSASTFAEEPAGAQSSEDIFINSLMEQMTLEEKVGQLSMLASTMAITGATVDTHYISHIQKGKVGAVFNAYTPEFTRNLQEIAVTQTRLKIPLLFGYDVIHGHKTIFPIPLGESCSWNLPLMESTAATASEEAAADGLHWIFAPMVDITRDARWGRVSEGAGEDAWLGSRIAAARVQGIQGKGYEKADRTMACVKHFAAYGAPMAGRDYNTVELSHRTLLQDYLPPYKAALDAGAETVMTSFNTIDGIPATANKWLVDDLLRKEWGFQGLVVSDYTGIAELINHSVAKDLKEAGELSLKAGVDMDMQSEGYVHHLVQSVADKKISIEEIDGAVRRVLRAKYKMGLFEDPFRFCNEERAKKTIMTPKNIALARQAARESIVLLKNEKRILPLKKDVPTTVALIGPFVKNQRDLIGNWSAAGDWKQAVNLYDAMQAATKNTAIKLLYAEGADITRDEALCNELNEFQAMLEINANPEGLMEEAVRTARQADVVILALGEAQGMTGEASSRTNLNLPECQRELIRAVAATGKPIIIVLMNGRPLALEYEDKVANAILETWYLGTQAGPAIADVLMGDYNPSGKLTMSFPRNAGQLPLHYGALPTGRPYAPGMHYCSHYLDAPNTPLYPFGYGLSYSEFQYGPPLLNSMQLKKGGEIKLSITVSNAGPFAGTEIVQLYMRDQVASVSQPVQRLCGFERVTLQPGEQKIVTFTIKEEDLRFIGPNNTLISEPGMFSLFVGSHSMNTKNTVFELLADDEK